MDLSLAFLPISLVVKPAGKGMANSFRSRRLGIRLGCNPSIKWIKQRRRYAHHNWSGVNARATALAFGF